MTRADTQMADIGMMVVTFRLPAPALHRVSVIRPAGGRGKFSGAAVLAPV